MAQNAVIIRITKELMATALNLGPEATIAGMQYDLTSDTLIIRISHPNLPPVAEGAEAPTATPVFKIHPDHDDLTQIMLPQRESQTMLPEGEP